MEINAREYESLEAAIDAAIAASVRYDTAPRLRVEGEDWRNARALLEEMADDAVLLRGPEEDDGELLDAWGHSERHDAEWRISLV